MKRKKKKRKVVERLHFASFAIKLNLSRRLGTLNLVLSRKSIRFVLFFPNTKNKNFFRAKKKRQHLGNTKIQHQINFLSFSSRPQQLPYLRYIFLLYMLTECCKLVFDTNCMMLQNINVSTYVNSKIDMRMIAFDFEKNLLVMVQKNKEKKSSFNPFIINNNFIINCIIIESRSSVQ